MDFFRIGEKIISRRKLVTVIDKILQLRMSGLSQLEVARRLGIDRSLISRLETLGEIHKGERIAVLGFPVANKEEVTEVLDQEGVEFIFLLTEEERWRFVQEHQGPELLEKIINLLAEVRTYDVVILLGSDSRIKTLGALMDCEVLQLAIGQSPLKEDRAVPIDQLINLIRQVKASRKTIQESRHVYQQTRRAAKEVNNETSS